jgi:hypothetical protein
LLAIHQSDPEIWTPCPPYTATVLLQGASKALGSWQLVARQVAGQAAAKVPKVRVNYLAAAVTPEQAAVQLEALTMNALMHTARASRCAPVHAL